MKPDEQLIVRLAQGFVRHQAGGVGDSIGYFALVFKGGGGGVGDSIGYFAMLFKERGEAMQNGAELVPIVLAERREPFVVEGWQQVVCVKLRRGFEMGGLCGGV